MTLVVVLFLFCSGFFHFTFASNRLRYFRLSEIKESPWNFSACSLPNETFVTLYDDEDSDFMKKFLNRTTWLGLRKGRNLTWSDGASVTFNKSSVNLTNGEQICEAIDNTTWSGFNCSERKYFMCYNGIEYKLIDRKKNWCQALQYCRNHFMDLVSISNDTQNDEVIRLGNGTSFWIGLMHDEWEWISKSCSSFRKWACYREGDYTQYNINVARKLLYTSGCTTTADFLCSKGIMRIKAIDKKLTWEEAFDYCKDNHTGLLQIENAEDLNAVQQWLNYTTVGGPFWIGLRQSRVFGFWIWSDRMVNYSNWKNGTQPELPMSNQCGVISKTDYKWSDENCLVPQNFLCEEKIVFMKN